MAKKSERIIQGHIPTTLIKMTIPSMIGMFGIMIFNIVDTYFVGQLGSVELAAISFTFPVIMVLNSIVFGIGTAAMTLFSKAVGQKNFEKEQQLATASLSLGITLSVTMAIAGFLTRDPLFRLMGADDTLLVYIKQYMNIWYLGAGFMVIPMLGDSVLRGLGDTFTPAFVMMTAALTNALLDPLLIFGIGPFPAMGIAGAALSTVLSRGFAAIVSILIQTFREHLLTFKNLTVKKLLSLWKDLFHIGIPNSAVRAITPLGTAFFTSILAKFGHEVVAGFGVAIKIESIFLAIISAFSITTTVFVGQNLGAHETSRAKEGIRIIRFILLSLGFIIATIFFFSGTYLASIFNDDAVVQFSTASYLKIVPFGYAFLALTQTSASIFNVFHKPYLAGALSLMQIALIAVPGSYVLSGLLGANGVFFAILAGFVIVGIVSSFALNRMSKVYLK